MKKKYGFWMALISLALMSSMALSSCEEDYSGSSKKKKDDSGQNDDSTGSSFSIVGTWGAYLSGYLTKNGVRYEEYPDNYAGTITFKSNGTCTVEGDTASVKYTLKGDTLTVDGESQTIQSKTSDKIVFKPITETEIYDRDTYVYYHQVTLRKVKQ